MVTTVQQRREAKAKDKRRKQVAFHAARIRATASSGRAFLSSACDYAKAVGDDIDDAGRKLLAQAIVAATEERRLP